MSNADQQTALDLAEQNHNELIAEKLAHELLFFYVRKNNIKGIEKALKDGADINGFNEPNHETALMIATQLGYEPIVRMLLEVKGINIMQPNKFNRTAYYIARDCVDRNQGSQWTDIAVLLEQALEAKGIRVRNPIGRRAQADLPPVMAPVAAAAAAHAKASGQLGAPAAAAAAPVRPAKELINSNAPHLVSENFSQQPQLIGGYRDDYGRRSDLSAAAAAAMPARQACLSMQRAQLARQPALMEIAHCSSLLLRRIRLRIILQQPARLHELRIRLPERTFDCTLKQRARFNAEDWGAPSPDFK